MSLLSIQQLQQLLDVVAFCGQPDSPPRYVAGESVLQEKRGEGADERVVERVLKQEDNAYRIEIQKIDFSSTRSDELTTHLFNERYVVGELQDRAHGLPLPVATKDSFGQRGLGVRQHFAGLDLDDLARVMQSSEDGRKRFADPAFHVQLMHGVLDCLEAWHAAGLVHGDFKPDNVCLPVKTVRKDTAITIVAYPAQIRLIDLGCTLLPIGTRRSQIDAAQYEGSGKFDPLRRVGHGGDYYPQEYRDCVIASMGGAPDNTVVGRTTHRGDTVVHPDNLTDVERRATNSSSYELDVAHGFWWDLYALAKLIEDRYLSGSKEQPPWALNKQKNAVAKNQFDGLSALHARLLIDFDQRKARTNVPTAFADLRAALGRAEEIDAVQFSVDINSVIPKAVSSNATAAMTDEPTEQLNVAPIVRAKRSFWVPGAAMICAGVFVGGGFAWLAREQSVALSAVSADTRADYAELCVATDLVGRLKRMVSSDAPCGWRKAPLVLSCIAGNFEQAKCSKRQSTDVMQRALRACQAATAPSDAEFALPWNQYRLRSTALMYLAIGDKNNARNAVAESLALSPNADKDTYIAAAQFFARVDDVERAMANLHKAKQAGLKYWDQLTTARYFPPDSAIYRSPAFAAFAKTLTDAPADSPWKYKHHESTNAEQECRE